jgi:hypothetical protein
MCFQTTDEHTMNAYDVLIMACNAAWLFYPASRQQQQA